MGARLGYLGTMLFLQNFQKAFRAAQGVVRSLKYLGSVAFRPISYPLWMGAELFRPVGAAVWGFIGEAAALFGGVGSGVLAGVWYAVVCLVSPVVGFGRAVGLAGKRTLCVSVTWLITESVPSIDLLASMPSVSMGFVQRTFDLAKGGLWCSLWARYWAVCGFLNLTGKSTSELCLKRSWSSDYWYSSSRRERLSSSFQTFYRAASGSIGRPCHLAACTAC
jgi:hypothetical protein